MSVCLEHVPCVSHRYVHPLAGNNQSYDLTIVMRQSQFTVTVYQLYLDHTVFSASFSTLQAYFLLFNKYLLSQVFSK